MTLPSFFRLLLGYWALAVVLALIKLAFDALAADARGAKLPARWPLSVVRNCVHCGVVFTSIVVFAAIFKTFDEIWDFSLKPFSYDLTAYDGPVKQAVLSVGCFICLMMVNRHIERLLDKLLPKGPASQTQRMENNSDRGVAKAE